MTQPTPQTEEPKQKPDAPQPKGQPVEAEIRYFRKRKGQTLRFTLVTGREVIGVLDEVTKYALKVQVGERKHLLYKSALVIVEETEPEETGF